MQIYVRELPTLDNSVCISCRIPIADRPLIRLPAQHVHLLARSLVWDGVLTRSSYEALVNLCEGFEVVDLRLLEALSPDRIRRVFRFLRRFFRSRGEPGRYNPLIHGLYHTSVTPVLCSLLTREEEEIDYIVVDEADNLRRSEVYDLVKISSMLGAELILVCNNPDPSLLSMADSLSMSPSLAADWILRKMGLSPEDLENIPMDLKANRVSVEKSGPYVGFAPVETPPRFDYLKRIFGDSWEDAYMIISELYSSGGFMSQQSLLELLQSNKIGEDVYLQLLRSDFLRLLQSAGGYSVVLTPKGLEYVAGLRKARR